MREGAWGRMPTARNICVILKQSLGGGCDISFRRLYFFDDYTFFAIYVQGDESSYVYERWCELWHLKTTTQNCTMSAATSPPSAHFVPSGGPGAGGVGAAPPPPAPPVAAANNGNAGTTAARPFWNFDVAEAENWVRRLAPGVPGTGGMLASHPLGSALLSNLSRALSSASSSCGNGGGGNGVGGGGGPDRKRARIGGEGGGGGDAYRVLDPSFARSGGDGPSGSSELPPGAILSRVTLGGLVNGLAGAGGGVVDTLTCIPLGDMTTDGGGDHVVDGAARKEERMRRMEGAVPTAGNMTLRELMHLARGLHRSIAAR